jgi:heme-degrading monooxygenase HmoA
MIKRVFRVRIHPALRDGFEERFATISIAAVESAPGCLDVSIYRPTPWAPEEYAMVTHWENAEALQAFAGRDWNKAVIPSGMEAFVDECWVHHYEAWR